MKNKKLELIRGLAALMVFFTHVRHTKLHFAATSTLYRTIFNWGTESVIIFFILSGVVISQSLKNHPKTPGKFLYGRLKRIYPLFLLGLLLGYIAGGYLSIPLGDFFFLGTTDAYISPVLSQNPVIWSLSFEVFFYVLFGLYISLNKSKLFITIWSAIAIVCIPLYYLQIHGISMQVIALFAFSSIWLLGYYLSEHIDKFRSFTLQQVFFISGLLFPLAIINYSDKLLCIVKYMVFAMVALPVFIYAMNAKQYSHPNKSWLSIFIIFIIVESSFFFYSNDIIYTLLCAIIPFITSILSFGLTAQIKPALLKFGLFTGYISYALYIIHYPLEQLFTTTFHTWNEMLVFFTMMPLIVALAYVAEKYYQRFALKILGTFFENATICPL